MTWKKDIEIAVYGESYACEHYGHKDTSWVLNVLSKYDREKCLAHGRTATSTWFSYSKFLEDITKYDSIKKVVFTYTAMYRIPYLPEEYASYSALATNLDSIEEPIKNAVNSYVNMLYSKSLNQFICQNIFDSVQAICESKNINIVNIIPFDSLKVINNEYDVSKRYGPVIYGLDNLSLMEAGNREYYKRVSNINWIDSECDNRCCHMNQENNNQVADKILELFDNYDKNIIYDFYNRSITSPELWARYNYAPYYND